jgi:hypothetical protein
MSRESSLQKLFSAYNQKLTAQRAQAFKNWADRFDEDVVEHAIDFVIGEDSRMPAISRMYNLSRERMMEVAQDTPEVECWFCDATGLIPGIYKDRQGMWTHGIISACKCTNGQRKKSKQIPINIFEHDPRYLDLMKVLKKKKKKAVSPWGAIPFFYEALRGAGLIQASGEETNLHKNIESILK